MTSSNQAGQEEKWAKWWKLGVKKRPVVTLCLAPVLLISDGQTEDSIITVGSSKGGSSDDRLDSGGSNMVREILGEFLVEFYLVTVVKVRRQKKTRSICIISIPATVKPNFTGIYFTDDQDTEIRCQLFCRFLCALLCFFCR